MPRSLRSSAVRFGNSAAVTSFSRNVASYCSSPRLFSHAPTSIAVASDLAMRAVDYRADELPLSRQRSLRTRREINAPSQVSIEPEDALKWHLHEVLISPRRLSGLLGFK